jgi:hypothetical protein
MVLTWDTILMIIVTAIFFGSLMLFFWSVFVFPKIFEKIYNKTHGLSVSTAAEVPEKAKYRISDADENEIIAVIAAAIAEEEGSGYSSNIIVKKVRKIDAVNPVWNSTGRLESLN